MAENVTARAEQNAVDLRDLGRIVAALIRSHRSRYEEQKIALDFALLALGDRSQDAHGTGEQTEPCSVCRKVFTGLLTCPESTRGRCPHKSVSPPPPPAPASETPEPWWSAEGQWVCVPNTGTTTNRRINVGSSVNAYSLACIHNDSREADRARIASAERQLREAQEQIAKLTESRIEEIERAIRAEAERDALRAQAEQHIKARGAAEAHVAELSLEERDLRAKLSALTAEQEQRAKPRFGFTCPECGPGVRADEDGCCAMCGADCEAGTK